MCETISRGFIHFGPDMHHKLIRIRSLFLGDHEQSYQIQQKYLTLQWTVWVAQIFEVQVTQEPVLKALKI